MRSVKRCLRKIVGRALLNFDEQTKRNFWKACKIDQLIIGSDGHVCAARIKIPTKSGTTILTRSLKHLIPLDVRLVKLEQSQTVLSVFLRR